MHNDYEVIFSPFGEGFEGTICGRKNSKAKPYGPTRLVSCSTASRLKCDALPDRTALLPSRLTATHFHKMQGLTLASIPPRDNRVYHCLDLVRKAAADARAWMAAQTGDSLDMLRRMKF